MTLEMKQRKCVKAQASIKWWKQKKENVTEFRQELKQALGGGEDLLCDGETGKKVFGVPSGYRKENKEAW